MAYHYAMVNSDGQVLYTLNGPEEFPLQLATDNNLRVLELTSILPTAQYRFTGGPYSIGKTSIADWTTVTEEAPSFGAVWNGSSWDEIPVYIGKVNTGRGSGLGDDDLNPSFIEFYDGTYAQNELELYVPSVATTISYDAALPYPYFFDSSGNVFNGVDYEMQVRVVATGQVLGEIVVPLTTTNVDVEFSLYP